MALYTGKGDKGTTKVLDSKERFSKDSAMAEALGSLDELNSFLGLCKKHAGATGIDVPPKGALLPDVLEEVQQNLFIVQAQVAGAKDKKIVKSKMSKMERVIGEIEEEIPAVTGFSVAGGSELSALLDVARTIARRTERRVVAVHENDVRKLTKDSLAYVNRLSSLLFALARLVNHRFGIKEKRPTYK